MPPRKVGQKAEPDATKTAVDLIRAGKVDLAEASAAMRFLIEASAAVVIWQIDLSAIEPLNGHVGGTITHSELTIGEQVRIMDETGLDWSHFDPRADQKSALTLLATVVCHRSPTIARDYAKAVAVVEHVTTQQFDDAYSVVEQRPPDPTSPDDD